MFGLPWGEGIPLKDYQLFEWVCCSYRIQAVLHRVRDGAAGLDGIVPRRDAAIFFVAPDVSAPLVTVVRDGEVPHYAGVLTHGEFKV